MTATTGFMRILPWVPGVSGYADIFAPGQGAQARGASELPSCRVIMPYAVMPPRLGNRGYLGFAPAAGAALHDSFAESRNAQWPKIFPISAIKSRSPTA